MSATLSNIPLDDGAKAAAAARTRSAWIAPVTAMMFILGAFAALALKTQNRVRTDNLPSSSYTGLAQAYWSLGRTISADQATISNLRSANTRLTESVTQGTPESGVLSEELKQSQLIAGLTEVTGPGVVVTLNDSKHAPSQSNGIAIPQSLLMSFIIHDADINRVVNELHAGGGEVCSVNGQRIISTTAIRCVGPAIQVNGVPVTPPYKISAIGEAGTLFTTLSLPGGVVDVFKQTDPAMISVQKEQKLVIPAYDGGVQFRYAKPVNAAVAAKSETSGETGV